MSKIEPHELIIAGHWIDSNGQVTQDADCQRIYELVKEHLIELGRDASGWNVLYRDPDDGRLWELSYPSSGSHGGGPPALCCLTSEDAHARFGI